MFSLEGLGIGSASPSREDVPPLPGPSACSEPSPRTAFRAVSSNGGLLVERLILYSHFGHVPPSTPNSAAQELGPHRPAGGALPTDEWSDRVLHAQRVEGHARAGHQPGLRIGNQVDRDPHRLLEDLPHHR